MKRVVHLLDDFAMGGVTRALGVFEEAELRLLAHSEIKPVDQGDVIAPALDADIIVTHFPVSWRRLAWFGSLRVRNRRARIVYVEHSYTSSFESHNVGSQRRFRALLRGLVRLVDDVVCVSQGQREWFLEASSIAPDRCRVIYPWSGRDELLQVPPLADRDAARPLRLAAYGRYSEVKNFAALIEAAGARPELCTLRIGGSGPLEEDLQQRAARYPNVALVGRVDDVTDFLTEADAVVVPSLWEAYGLVATEARLAARAILVADVDGLPEQVGSAGLYAPMGDAKAIAQAIDRFAAMPLPKMGAAGRNDVLDMRSTVISGWADLLA